MPETFTIDPNEKVLAYAELVLTPFQVSHGGLRFTPTDWSGRQRWRIAWVNRGDTLATYHEVSPHPIGLTELRIPSLWEHTWSECVGLADDYCSGRRGAERDAAFVKERQAESTLIKDFMEQVEDRVALVKNQSVVGPHFRKQRDGFPHALRKRIEGAANHGN